MMTRNVLHKAITFQIHFSGLLQQGLHCSKMFWLHRVFSHSWYDHDITWYGFLYYM